MEVDGTIVRMRKGGFGQRVMVLWKRKRGSYMAIMTLMKVIEGHERTGHRQCREIMSS